MNIKLGSFFAIAILTLLLTATAQAETFIAYLNGAQEVPPVATAATGYARIVVDPGTNTLTFTVVFNNLSSNQTMAHIHAPAAIGATAGIIIDFGAVGGTSGTISGSRAITNAQITQLRQHLGYVNVHSVNNGAGEIRGQLGINRPVDYDGDGRTDYSVLRFPNVAPPGVSQIDYHNLQSTAGYQVVRWGNANTDFPVPGDYDGDSKDDVAIYRDGANPGDQSEFWILQSASGIPKKINFGTSGDQGISRDYDGDGKTDIAVFRRGADIGFPAYWYIIQSSNGVVRITQFGTTGDVVTGSSGDTPAPGDYDGDGKFDLTVYRFGGLAPNNHYIVLRSGDGGITYQPWGNFQTDYILPGDYDGDGKTDFCAARTGATANTPVDWFILQSSNGQTRIQRFGISSDLPTQGDYDGDARTDLSMYRRGPSAAAQSNFWVFNSFTNTTTVQQWGLGADFPTATFDAR